MRRLTDLPWQGRVVEIRLHARPFRCANSQCPRRFTERLPETVQPKARRTVRLGESHLAIGFAVGGEPGSRLSDKLAMPVSGDTLLRMVRAAGYSSRRKRRGWLASTTGPGAKDSATERSSAIWRATACWIYCRIEMPARSHHGLTPSWHRGHRARSCRRLCRGRPSRCSRCNAGRRPLASSPEPGRSVASGRRSPSQGGQRRRKGHGVRDGRKCRSRAGTTGRNFPET